MIFARCSSALHYVIKSCGFFNSSHNIYITLSSRLVLEFNGFIFMKNHNTQFSTIMRWNTNLIFCEHNLKMLVYYKKSSQAVKQVLINKSTDSKITTFYELQINRYFSNRNYNILFWRILVNSNIVTKLFYQVEFLRYPKLKMR